MLYDPKWEQKADSYSLASLIAWLEKQPADKRYCYFSSGECLLAQYFTDAGFENVRMFSGGFWSGDRPCPRNVGWPEAKVYPEGHALPPGFNNIALCAGTFGRALESAKLLMNRG